jgi:thioredoxin 1
MKTKSWLLILIFTSAASAVVLGTVNKKGELFQERPVQSGLPVILELGSNSCVSCKAMNEVLAKVETRFSSQVRIDKVDVFKNEAAIDQYGLRLIPTQILRDAKGAEVFRHEGFISYEKLIAKLKDLNLLQAEEGAGHAR